MIKPEVTRPLLILVAPTGSYRTYAYIEAARHSGLDILVVSDSAHSIVNAAVDGLTVSFEQPDHALQTVLQSLNGRPVHGVMATDDRCVALANRVSEKLGLPHNPEASSRLTHRKDLAREALESADCLVPRFARIPIETPAVPATLDFPLVIKPLALSASRGVIRVNNPAEYQAAIKRVGAIIESTGRPGIEGSHVLLEEYIDGEEYAVEGFLIQGQFHLLTIFDKPDPLQGPFFEETYYLAPSRLAATRQRQVIETVESSCKAYGLVQGPVHAELRINQHGIYLIELANRTIGGQCGRLIESITGYRLEEIVLMGMTNNLPEFQHSEGSSGVLMIPVPRAGLLKRVEGLTDALATPYIEDLEIHINTGYELIPLPEGASYLGFIFAKSPDYQTTWNALKAAHEKLRFITQPSWRINARRDCVT